MWEPILATDFTAPITWVLGRASDRRVQQYWDPDRVLAGRMAADARPPQPVPDCCDRSGVLWDLVAVYPKGATWDQQMPIASVFNGSVVDMSTEIEAALSAR